MKQTLDKIKTLINTIESYKIPGLLGRDTSTELNFLLKSIDPSNTKWMGSSKEQLAIIYESFETLEGLIEIIDANYVGRKENILALKEIKDSFEEELNKPRFFNKKEKVEVRNITTHVYDNKTVYTGKYYAIKTLNSNGLSGIANIAAIDKTAAIEHFQQENPGTSIEWIEELCDWEWEVEHEN